MLATQTVSADSLWISNTTVTTGLGDIGSRSSLTIFQKDSVWTLISGEWDGNFNGYIWDGSSWVSNSSVVTGLGNIGFASTPAVFQKDSVWTLISGNNTGLFTGLIWDGSSWVSNTTVTTGLVDIGSDSTPAVFQKDSVWTLISGNYTGNFNGYIWDGSSWVSNSSVVTGLVNMGNSSSPAVFQKDSVWILISGNTNGNFYGYIWDGSSWVSNTTVTTGLVDIGSDSTPAVFQKDSVWTLISGNYTGLFTGFNINELPTTPQISFPINTSRHIYNNINYTWNTSTYADNDPITYDFWLSNQSDFSSTVTRSNYTNNYTGNIATIDGVTYFGKVRAYDSYNYSNWSDAVNFTENTDPEVLNISLLPVNTSITSNLTVSMNTTDDDGDTLTNYYLWYKNDVLQAWSGTYVNYTDNFTAGDVIYVFGYANDTFENSSQLQSNIVSIGSNNSAPSFTTLTLTPSSAKNNQTIHINASGISDDSTSWQLQTYYKSGGNVYIANSTFVNTSYINITATIPFTTGGAHTIYAVIYDSGNATGQSNLTSAEAFATFITDLTNPTIVSSSVSADAITVGTSVLISATVDGQGANVSSVLVKVLRPDATSANWTMTCDSGEIVNCTYSYTTTSDVGEYDVTYFYVADDSGINAAISSSLFFVASNPSSGGGGGGGGTVVIVQPTTTPLTPSLNLSIIGITDGARSLSDIEAINKCLTESLFLSNECSNAVTTTLKETANWWTILGVPFASVLIIFIMNIFYPKKRSYLDAGIYSLIIIIFLLAMNLMGFNIFIWNYIYNNSLSAFTFFSFMTWGFVGTVLLDEFVFTRPFGGWEKLGRRLQI